MSGVEFDASTNVAMLGGQPVIFHCHHYNCALQKVIEQNMGAAAADLLADAAATPARQQLATLAADGKGEVLQLASTVFAQLGFGTLALDRISETGGTAQAHASHYALGWLAKYGPRAEPACHFVRGYLAGALAAAYELDLSKISVRETHCAASGASEACAFSVEVR